MRQSRDYIFNKLDWITILIYIILVTMGWLNICAVVYDAGSDQSLMSLSLNSGKQLLFITVCIVIIMIILIVDIRFYDTFSYIIFIVALCLLLLTLVIGKEVGGNKAWIGIGSFGIQPSEFAKWATALTVAKLIGSTGFKIDKFRNQLMLYGIIALPIILILLQKDAGTALVFTGFILVFFREGISPFFMIVGLLAVIIFILTLLIPNQIYLHGAVAILLILAIFFGQKKIKHIITLIIGALIIMGTIESVDYIITDILKPHQQNRIKALINPNADPLGYGWNVTQSKIAIGSGGLFGKGFLKGTQTKFDFVPEQSTDFIFCAIGEEHGFVGSAVIIILFVTLLLRIIFLAERQKNQFARSYIYGIASIIFFHFAINIGMTVGLFPIIGIPLPFFSYGGSALCSFTILLFVALKLDAHRGQVLQRL